MTRIVNCVKEAVLKGYFILFWEKLLKQLVPYDVVNFEEKVRCGNKSDGGYVIPRAILPLADVLYTYGVGDDISFEKDFLGLRNVPVRLYDPTVPDTFSGGQIFFKREGISQENSFRKHLKDNVDEGKNILLKMDIEGCEWRVIPQIVKPYVVGIILEIHLSSRSKFPAYIKALKKINAQFTLVHIHGNNCATSYCFDGKTLPALCELIFINNQYVAEKKAMSSPLPGEWDCPNDPRRQDGILDFYL